MHALQQHGIRIQIYTPTPPPLVAWVVRSERNVMPLNIVAIHPYNIILLPETSKINNDTCYYY